MNAEGLKNSILQLAIQGKLVEQREEEGTAEELYNEIQLEKEKLIEEGEIRRQKKLPEITEDEISFEIPENWKWVRLEDIILKDLGGGTPSRQNPQYWGGNLPWMTVKDFTYNNDSVYLDKTIEQITDQALTNSSTNLVAKDNIIVCTRVSLGKIVINTIDTCINQDLRALIVSERINKLFLIYVYKRMTIIGTGTTVKGIKRNELLEYLIPLPPLEEQKRI